jgi:hypothetical protein
LNTFSGLRNDRRMRLFLLALVIAAGCSATVQGPRPDYGKLTAHEAPPSALDPYFEDKADHVWVPGRWARLGDQWMWQPGFHQKARPGFVFLAGYWDRDAKTKQFAWRAERWIAERLGKTHVPGHWDRRGVAIVWIRDKWVVTKPGERWVPTKWTGDGDARTLVRGHWAERTASR